MPEVTVEVVGKAYRLGCGEGEERHLMALAARVDGEAARLVDELGQMPEGRLMLMSALILADRLSETEAALRAAERRAAGAEEAAGERQAGPDTGREVEIAATVEALAIRIETLAERIDGGA